MRLCRRWLKLSALLAIGAATAACGRLSPPLRTNEPAVAARLQVPDLMALPDQKQLTLSQLEEGLRQYLRTDKGPAAQQLNKLYSKWRLSPAPETKLLLESDLDGDGTQEIMTTLNDASSALGSGTLFVIYRNGDKYAVDRSAEVVMGAGLYTVADIDRDGQAEILWSSTTPGANTPTTTLFVSKWQPGALHTVPTGISATYAKVEVDGSDILIRGGVIGGYGAGRVQRIRTDRYLWRDEQLQLVDRRYAPSEFGYHLLQDGIVAEEWNRPEDARLALRKAMESSRTVLTTEDTVPPAWEERFGYAVRTLAQFRLGLQYVRAGQAGEHAALISAADGPYAGLVHLLNGGTSAASVCQQAATWATTNPEFLEALNIPRGWANPKWKPDSLCGPLPMH